MADASHPALDPQTENAIIDDIIALGWSTDIATQPLRIIQNRLVVEEEQAILLLLNFQRRNLIFCKPERMANNMAETSVRSPVMRVKWIKSEERWK